MYEYPNYPSEGDQQQAQQQHQPHSMQQSQQRYPNMNFVRGQPPGGQRMSRASHPSSHGQQQQSLPPQQQIRSHGHQQVPVQSPYVGYTTIPITYGMHPYARYALPAYPAAQQVQYPQGYVVPVPSNANLASFGSNLFFGHPSLQPGQVQQNPQHHGPSPYYSPPSQPPQQLSQYIRAPVQGIPMTSVQVPAQAHAVPQVQHQQPTTTIVPQTVSGLVTGPIPSQPQTEHREAPPRRKNILNIIDPASGRSVIDTGSAERAPSASPGPTVETVIGHDDFGGTGKREVGIVGHADEGLHQPSQSPVIFTNEDIKTSQPESITKAKSEFYHLITAAADEGGRSSSTPDPVTEPRVSPTPVSLVHSTTSAPQQPSPSATSPQGVAQVTIPAFEHLAASAPASVVLSTTPVDDRILEEPSIFPSGGESNPSSGLLSPVLHEEPSHLPIKEEVLVSPEISEPVIEPSNIETSPPISSPILEECIEPVTIIPDRETNFNISTVSISPEPIERYIDATPPKDGAVPSTESGEPSSVGDSTRESTASPSFHVKGEGESYPSTPNQLSDDEMEKGVEKIELTSILTSEPTFHNGGSLGDGSGDDEEMEEGELMEEETGEEEVEPTRKGRIQYGREQLMNMKSGASKDIEGIDSIPPELIRDGKSPSNNYGAIQRQLPVFGQFGGMRNTAMGKMGPNNRGPYPGRVLPMNAPQWQGLGPGGVFQIPPQPPTRGGPPPVTLQLNPVKLRKAENAWMAAVPSKRPDKPDENVSEEDALIEEMKKKTRGILNKLTPENFNKLVDTFLELGFETTDDRMRAVIEILFEKAIDEPNFSSAYAKLIDVVCQRLAAYKTLIKKKILDQCQKEFQTGNSEEEALKALEEKLLAAAEDKKVAIKLEIEEKKFMARRRSLGNVRFIGELYKLAMLTPKIMVECVTMLLDLTDEESLESLCKLLATVGKMLDDQLQEYERRNNPKWAPEPKFMDKTFEKMQQLSKDKKLSSRIRFALLDVCDLRESQWKPRRDANAPKTIEEVRKAAIREEQEEKKQLLNLPPIGPPPPAINRMSNMNSQKKGDWNTVQPSNKSSRFTASKKQTSEPTGEMPKFAPQGSWGRTGIGAPSKSLQNTGPRFHRLPMEGETPLTPSRDEIVQELPTPTRTPSNQSSRESSRPQTPTREGSQPTSRFSSQGLAPLSPTKDIQEFNVPDTVSSIFNEFSDVQKLDIDWVKARFPGSKIVDFVEELSRQVCEMTKEDQQKTAAGLTKDLLKNELITKAQVVEAVKIGAINDMPDIEVDVPKLAVYLGMFLCELFGDEKTLSWLVTLGELIATERSWIDLVTNTLTFIKYRHSEDVVKGIYKDTKGASELPIQNIAWIVGDPVSVLTANMKKVLSTCDDWERVNVALREYSWDLRDESIVQCLTEAICSLSLADSKLWNMNMLDLYFSPLTDKTSLKVPLVWQQAKHFIERNNVGKDQESVLWTFLQQKNLTYQEKSKDKSKRKC